MSRLVYLCHQFGGKPENIVSAEEWSCWLTEQLNALFIAPWTVLARHGTYTEAAHLELCKEFVRRTDEAIIVGGCVSPGIKTELGPDLRHAFQGVVEVEHPRDLNSRHKLLLADYYGRRT